MVAGRLRSRVTFQGEVQTPDDGGGYAATWAAVTTVWGEFRPERGNERVEAGRIAAPLSGTLRVRWSSLTNAITTRHRALIDSEPYDIRSIANPDRRHRFLEMTVEKGVGT